MNDDRNDDRNDMNDINDMNDMKWYRMPAVIQFVLHCLNSMLPNIRLHHECVSSSRTPPPPPVRRPMS